MEIHMETDGQRIWLASRQFQDFSHQMKGYPGVGASVTGPEFTWMRDTVGLAPRAVVTLPLSYRTCMDIRDKFKKHDVQIHPRLWDWAKEEQRLRRELAVIVRSKEWPTPFLEREYPELNDAIHGRPFQSVGVAFATRRRFGIFGDHPGLGKTLQVSAAAVEARLRGPQLIVAPSSAAAITWPNEFDRWLPDEPYLVVEGDKGKRRSQIDKFWADVAKNRRGRNWMFINPEMLQDDQVVSAHKGRRMSVSTGDPRFPALFNRPWQSIIVDEAHKYLPTKEAQQHRQSMIRQGLKRLPVLPTGMKFAMSGTPLKGNPLNLWGTLNWLFPLQYTSYWAFVDRWFDVESDMIGEMAKEDNERKSKDVNGLAKKSERDFSYEIDAVMIRRTKEEVAPDLPAKLYGGTLLNRRDPESPVGVWLPMLPKQQKAYDGVVNDAMLRLDNGTLLPGGVLAEMTRCKQLAISYGEVFQKKMSVPSSKLVGVDFEPEDAWYMADAFRPIMPSNKFDWIVQFLAERGIERKGWGDKKVVIASQYTAVIDMFAAELTRKGVPSHLLTGKQNVKQRKLATAAFQGNGGPRVFFLNTDAGGTSLTLDAADDLIFIDEKWEPSDQEQVEDRIHRLSRIHQVGIWYLRSSGTIDERIAERNDGSARIVSKLMDGPRGVAFARQLIAPEGMAA